MTVAGDYETVARERLQPAVYDYFAGGAGDQFTISDNVQAWQRIKLRPRVLRDVGVVDTRTAMLGAPVAAPIGIAPTAAPRERQRTRDFGARRGLPPVVARRLGADCNHLPRLPNELPRQIL